MWTWRSTSADVAASVTGWTAGIASKVLSQIFWNARPVCKCLDLWQTCTWVCCCCSDVSYKHSVHTINYTTSITNFFLIYFTHPPKCYTQPAQLNITLISHPTAEASLESQLPQDLYAMHNTRTEKSHCPTTPQSQMSVYSLSQCCQHYLASVCGRFSTSFHVRWHLCFQGLHCTSHHPHCTALNITRTLRNPHSAH